jgi:hypothetical protein
MKMTALWDNAPGRKKTDVSDMRIRAMSKLRLKNGVGVWELVRPGRGYCPVTFDVVTGSRIPSHARLTHRRDDGGSTHVWNIGLLPQNYTAPYPRGCHLYPD